MNKSGMTNSKVGNSDQEQFMQHIADRLGRKRVIAPPRHPYRGAPTFWKEYNLSLDERVNLFMENWQKAGGHAQRFKNMESLKTFITETALEMSARRFIRHNQAELNELNLEEALPEAEFTIWGTDDNESLLAKAAGADIGMIAADYAVAVTGSVVLKSDESKGRTVSLLPTALMILIPVEAVITRMGQVMEQLNQISADVMPAGIHFISGPSRSADIENDLTIGVHGPGVVYALIMD